MIYTLADARAQLGRFIDGGTCDSAIQDQYINAAISRLVAQAEGHNRMERTVRITVRNREFPLPREAEKILWVDVNGQPSRVFNTSYQFMSAGPGDLDVGGRQSCSKYLMDLGEYPYMFPIPLDDSYPDGLHLIAFSTAHEDVDLSLTLRGVDTTHMDIRTGSTPGEVLGINQFSDGVDGVVTGTWDTYRITTNRFIDLDQVYKPKTRGYITLYALDEATSRLWLVAKYHPDDTKPMYRRYRLTNTYCCSSNCINVLMLVKMKPIPLSYADDVIPFDSLEALKLMVMAISFENSKDLANAGAYEANALRLMNNELAHKQLSGGTPAIIDVERKMTAQHLNHRIL